MTSHEAPVVLYDGTCGFCDRTVQLILRVDRRGVFRFARLDGPFAASVLAHRESLRGIDSLMLVEPGEHGRVLVRSEAMLGIARHLGGAWQGVYAVRVLPSRFLDWAYDRFARHRHRIVGPADACTVRSAETAGRFID